MEIKYIDLVLTTETLNILLPGAPNELFLQIAVRIMLILNSDFVTTIR